jgi:hypothetical protein
VAPLVPALHGALFTRRRQPRVQDPRAFGVEVAIPPWAHRTSPGVSPVPPLVPDAMFPVLSNLRHRSTTIRAFGTEGRHVEIFPAQQFSRNMSSVSVSVKPIPRRFLRETEAVR